MAVVLLRADEGRLWEEGPVVVATGVLFTVGLPGDIAVFVAVMVEIAVVQIQLQATLFIGGNMQRGVDGITAAEMHPPAVWGLAYSGAS